MVLATTVPLGLFAAALIRASWTQQEVMVDRQNIELARAISVAIDQEVDRTIGALTVLSAFIPPASDGYHAFYDVSRRIAPDQQWESVQLVAPPGGVFVATDAPFDAPPSVVNEDWVREVVATHKPVVSRVRKDSALGSWVISIGVPVVRNGAVTSVLGARIHAREFGDILRRQSVPPDGLVTVFDQAPAIVTRTMNEDALVGQGATAEFLARSRDAAEGAWRAKTREGVDSYAAWSRSPLTGWTVGLAIPSAAIVDPMRRSFYAITAAGIAISTLGLFCAMRLRQRLVAAQLAIAATARTLALGLPISAPESSIAELQDLSVALREAAAILKMRRQEREEPRR